MADKGAHFHRCDLQVHTPRDLNWGGPIAVTDEERLAYAATLVDACRKGGIAGIAITDHHDMAFVPFVRRAAAAETDENGKLLPKHAQLVVFPGMELTLGVPCQALLLFDAEFPDDLFSLAMTALAITPSAASESKIAEIQRLHPIQSLKQLKAELDKHTFLKDRYIVFPNVGENGQFSLIRKGQAGKYTEMPCVGGYVDGDLGKLGKGTRDIVAGKNKEWGNKRVACYQTSDNRHADHRDLGRSTTWIKWAVPTAEALRQACLAQESRVSQEPPILPSIVLESISISNSVFMGPIELELNPQYSALIGGRGTGKSTILEYLRWALCDQPPGVTDEDTPNYLARRARLIEQTLKPVNATVQVRFAVNGVQHIVRRSSQDGTLLMKVGGDEMRPCTEDDVRTLLPIQAYSQKQLSDVSVRVEELSRFITTPIRSELGRIDRLANEQAGVVRQTYATKRRQRTLALALQKRDLEEKSLTGQADALRAALSGLSDEDRTLLARGKTFDAADRSVQSWKDGANTLHIDAGRLLAKVKADLEESKTFPGEPEAAILTRANTEYRQLLSDAVASLTEIVDRAQNIAKAPAVPAPDRPWDQWSQKMTEFRAAYDAAVKRSSAHSEKMTQLRAIEEQLSQHIRETTRLKDELRALDAAEAAYQNERDKWLALLVERDAFYSTQVVSLAHPARVPA